MVTDFQALFIVAAAFAKTTSSLDISLRAYIEHISIKKLKVYVVLCFFSPKAASSSVFPSVERSQNYKRENDRNRI